MVGTQVDEVLDLGFETVGNATLIVHDGRPVLATDPWLSGPAYFGSWGLTHEIPAPQLASVHALRVRVGVARPSRPPELGVAHDAQGQEDPAAGPSRWPHLPHAAQRGSRRLDRAGPRVDAASAPACASCRSRTSTRTRCCSWTSTASSSSTRTTRPTTVGAARSGAPRRRARRRSCSRSRATATPT